MYTDAAKALKNYHEAQADGAPPLEVERLRQIAESQYQPVIEYQLKALGFVRKVAERRSGKEKTGEEADFTGCK